MFSFWTWTVSRNSAFDKWVNWNIGDEREFDYNPEMIPNPRMGIISSRNNNKLIDKNKNLSLSVKSTLSLRGTT